MNLLSTHLYADVKCAEVIKEKSNLFFTKTKRNIGKKIRKNQHESKRKNIVRKNTHRFLYGCNQKINYSSS